jgi:hypothetical protein
MIAKLPKWIWVFDACLFRSRAIDRFFICRAFAGQFERSDAKRLDFHTDFSQNRLEMTSENSNLVTRFGQTNVKSFFTIFSRWHYMMWVE